VLVSHFHRALRVTAMSRAIMHFRIISQYNRYSHLLSIGNGALGKSRFVVIPTKEESHALNGRFLTTFEMTQRTTTNITVLKRKGPSGHLNQFSLIKCLD